MSEEAALSAVRLGNRARGDRRAVVGGGTAPRLGLLIGLGATTTLDDEIAKVDLGERHGVTTVTDLTTSRDERLLDRLLTRDIAVGTVPAYALAPVAAGRATASAARTLFHTIERQVRLGVDFLSIHPSLSRRLVERLPDGRRTIPITSRGGALVLQVMSDQGVDNPFRTVFDDLLALCAEYRVVLSFVGSLRPGSVVDAFEPLHLAELNETAGLAHRAHEAGVQTMVELLNHVSLAHIEPYVKLGRSLFPHSALGALGPTPTDIAVGLDDVAGAIGAAVAARAGIDWINMVTAGEHSHLPRYADTARALSYFRLGLHVAAVAGGHDERDRALSGARACNDWAAMARLAIDTELAERLYAEHGNHQGAACSMCNATCPLVRYERLKRREGEQSRQQPTADPLDLQA